MDFREVKLVYAAISRNDNRALDESKADEWHRAIIRKCQGRENLADCLAVVDEWFDEPRTKYFEKSDFLLLLLRRLRLTPKQITDDVNSARARKLIDAEWDAREPVPLEVAQKLALARAEAQQVMPAIEGGRWPSLKEIGVAGG